MVRISKRRMSLGTVPKTLYKIPNPQLGVSEYYCVFAEVLPSATDPVRRWVVGETHGWWDDAAKQAVNGVQTLSPTDPKHCVSLHDAFELIENQVRSRVGDGFKYLAELDPYTGKTTITELP